VFPAVMDGSSLASECTEDLYIFGVVLFIGAFVTFLASRQSGAITALVPGAIGLMCSSTLTPSVLKCRQLELGHLDHAEVHVAPAYMEFALLYLLGALSTFVLLTYGKDTLKKATEEATGCLKGVADLAVALLHLMSNFLAMSAAAVLNATTKEELRFYSPKYLSAFLGETPTNIPLPNPATLQYLWAMGGFLMLPRLLGAMQPIIDGRKDLIDFCIKLCAFYVALNLLGATDTLISVATDTSQLTSSANAPLLKKTLLVAAMFALAVIRVLLPSAHDANPGAKHGLAAIVENGVGSKEAQEETRDAFIDHTVGMSLGWSLHPLVKALYMRLYLPQFTEQASVGPYSIDEPLLIAGPLYTLASTWAAAAAYTWLWHLAAEMREAQQGAADAGFTADDGGDDGGGGV